LKIVPINQVRRPLRRNQKPAGESACPAQGRELATQRDTAMFRVAEIGQMAPGAPTPFIVQRLAQLWPTPPRTDPGLASAAYAKAEERAIPSSQRALALVA